TAGKKLFAQLAQEMLDKKQPGLYNQAIMDFGAIQCKPKNPNCDQCIFRLECVAYNQDQVATLPVKLKGRASRNRYFHYFLFGDADGMYMIQRDDKDIWANLYEFPLYESAAEVNVDFVGNILSQPNYFGQDVSLFPFGQQVKHVLSHQNIYTQFYCVSGYPSLAGKKSLGNYFIWDKIDKLAKHKLIFSFLEKNKQLISTKL